MVVDSFFSLHSKNREIFKELYVKSRRQKRQFDDLKKSLELEDDFNVLVKNSNSKLISKMINWVIKLSLESNYKISQLNKDTKSLKFLDFIERRKVKGFMKASEKKKMRMINYFIQNKTLQKFEIAINDYRNQLMEYSEEILENIDIKPNTSNFYEQIQKLDQFKANTDFNNFIKNTEAMNFNHFLLTNINNFMASSHDFMNDSNHINNMNQQMQQNFMNQQMQQQFINFSMQSVTPFDHGGFIQGNGFNPSDTMAHQMHEMHTMNHMNHMNSMNNNMHNNGF